jgi:hypothetical protein
MNEEYSVGYSEGYQAGWNAAMDATPPAQLAPAQPVAWVNHGENRITRATGWDGYGALYAAPPAQPAPVPLTDEQISAIGSKIFPSTWNPRHVEFARAIEAKLQERNA